ncbi:extracellular solute-binding protein [Tabrizicola sp.]|uniref:extracellular solute-binding protein n=1 Tax=Tabrizicola sp. TaxID=2005166 RepID=UPI003F2D4372
MASGRRDFLGILGAAAAAAAAIVYFGLGGDIKALMPSGQGEPVEVRIASSVTKKAWLEAAAKSFAESNPETASGKPITIKVSSVLSGESMLQIAEGTLQPTVWSPGETAWVDQLTQKWALKSPNPISTAACTPTVHTPVGLAMWEPMAQALGWPDQPIRMSQLIDLANNPEGWASLGHPEWGKLRLGHTHPQYSSAGLLFLGQVIYSVTGKTEGITPTDIYSPQVRTALETLAANTSKYGMVTTDLLNSMAARGPAFLHVASAFEEGTMRTNAEKGDQLRWPLVFVFPADGTFWSDHPYCVLDGSGWVTPDEAEAANLFLAHLTSAAMQDEAANHFVRPLDGEIASETALARIGGTDLAASPATIPPFAIPSPEVSEAIIDQFYNTKRKATVILTLDVSGSMSGEAIRSATSSTAEFLDRLHPKDRVGLIAFSTSVQELTPISPVADVVENLKRQVLALPADGGTNLHGAVCRAAELLRAEQAKDLAAGENRLYGIVVLSDGKDTAGQLSANEMMATCLAANSEQGEGPRVFVLAFGTEVDGPLMDRLARETGGMRFDAAAGSVGNAYLKISAEQ